MAKPVTEIFEWDKQRSDAAVLLAQGYNNSETARQVGCNRSTIGRWLKEDEFAKTVDEMSLMYGGASKAYRIRMLNQALRQKIDEEDKIDLTGVSFLDLIKEMRMQTEGIRIGILDKLIAADEKAGPVAGSGSEGSRSLPEPKPEETE